MHSSHMTGSPQLQSPFPTSIHATNFDHCPNWITVRTPTVPYATCSMSIAVTTVQTETATATPKTTTTMLMIEGPKFSGFDFAPPTKDGQDESLSRSSSGEPFYIRGHRILLPPKDSPQADGLLKDNDTGETVSHTSKTANSVWDCVTFCSLPEESVKQEEGC